MSYAFSAPVFNKALINWVPKGRDLEILATEAVFTKMQDNTCSIKPHIGSDLGKFSNQEAIATFTAMPRMTYFLKGAAWLNSVSIWPAKHLTYFQTYLHNMCLLCLFVSHVSNFSI